MRRFALILLLMVGMLQAADVKITGTLKVPKNSLVMLKAEGLPAGSVCFWSVSPKLSAGQMKKGKDCIFFTAEEGKYTVNVRYVYVADKTSGALDGQELDIEAQIGQDLPPTPVPPPGPTPPLPVPPAPLPAGEMRVLVVYESADMAKLPKTQYSVFYSTKVRAALNAKAAKDSSQESGKGWAMWDKDSDTSKVSPFWQAAMKRPRSTLPAIHIFRGDACVYEGALPVTVDDMLALIEKWSAKEKGK